MGPGQRAVRAGARAARSSGTPTPISSPSRTPRTQAVRADAVAAARTLTTWTASVRLRSPAAERRELVDYGGLSQLSMLDQLKTGWCMSGCTPPTERKPTGGNGTPSSSSGQHSSLIERRVPTVQLPPRAPQRWLRRRRSRRLETGPGSSDPGLRPFPRRFVGAAAWRCLAVIGCRRCCGVVLLPAVGAAHHTAEGDSALMVALEKLVSMSRSARSCRESGERQTWRGSRDQAGRGCPIRLVVDGQMDLRAAPRRQACREPCRDGWLGPR